jgi:hypothetical protein
MSGIGEILKAALEEDPPLTASSQKAGFGCPKVLRRRFPAQYQALLRERRTYKEAQRNQLRSDLVYFLHGDLACAIAAGH